MARILLVEDEKSIRICMGVFIGDEGHDLHMAESAPEALRLLQNNEFDIVITDICMSEMTGMQLLESIKRTSPNMQVILMTGDPTVHTAAVAVRAGASDYLVKPITRDDILKAISTALRIRGLENQREILEESNKEYSRNLELLVKERTQELNTALERLSRAMEGIILAMSTAVESRDPYTAGHQQRVAALARAIATNLGLPEDRINAVYYAALVHDIGKIGVPADFLSSPGVLRKEAMDLVREHPAIGYGILNKVEFPWPIARIMLQHHERLDGSGYPSGLTGGEIMQEALIIAVADVVEAMASHRPYRAALGIDKALAEVRKMAGILYDQKAVDSCVGLFRRGEFSLNAGSDLEGEVAPEILALPQGR